MVVISVLLYLAYQNGWLLPTFKVKGESEDKIESYFFTLNVRMLLLNQMCLLRLANTRQGTVLIQRIQAVPFVFMLSFVWRMRMPLKWLDVDCAGWSMWKWRWLKEKAMCRRRERTNSGKQCIPHFWWLGFRGVGFIQSEGVAGKNKPRKAMHSSFLMAWLPWGRVHTVWRSGGKEQTQVSNAFLIFDGLASLG